MVDVLERWACGRCGDVYIHEDDAEECCEEDAMEDLAAGRGDIETETCPICFREYQCCDLNSIGHDLNLYAIRVAGHCQTCNPHYSYDEQQAIEKMAWEESGTAMRLNA